MEYRKVFLNQKKEESLERFHPWIFSGAIAKIEGTFCITGKSSLGSRTTLKEMIEAAGGKVTGSVSSKTTYLVANKPENTAKYNNALQFGTKIINDEELLQLLGK